MTLAFRGARLIDGTGGDPVERADVLVDGERIGSLSGGRHDEAIDLEGMTLLPGLIDAHSHLGLVDLSEAGKTAPAAVTAAKIFRVCSLTLDAGFTTVRDAGGVDGGLARATAEGLVRGPRILPSGPLHCQTGGHGDMRPPFDHRAMQHLPGLLQISRTVDGPDDMRRAVREAFRHGATQIKVAVSGGVVSLTDSIEDAQLTIEELRAAVEEAEARGTYVMAHAHSVRGMRNGLAAGVRSFEHASFLDVETAKLIAEAGAVIVPTMAVIHLLADEWEEWGLPPETVPRIQGILDGMADAIRIAMDAGITIGSGSDLLGPEQNRRGLELVLKARVMGAMEAIVSATRTNAALLGLAGEIGTIEPGKRADLIAVDGDPLAEPELFDDPARVRLVVRDGRIAKNTL